MNAPVNTPANTPVPPRRLWWLAAGFFVWCSALVVLYGLHAVGCVFGWPSGLLRASLVLVLFAHLAVLGWMWRRFCGPPPAPEHAFLYTVVAWTLLAALAASVITFVPVLFLKTCI